jgi:hypothetical protein
VVHSTPAHLTIPKTVFCPRHAALRLQRLAKSDFPVRISGHVALAKLASFGASHNGILDLGYKPSGLASGPINGSVNFAARMRVLTTKTTVLGYDQIGNRSLASARSIKGLGTEQLLNGRYRPQLRPVRGVQPPKPADDERNRFQTGTIEVKPQGFRTLLRSMNEMTNSLTTTPRRFAVTSIPFLPAVGDPWAPRVHGVRPSFLNVGDEESLRARPPTKEEQSDLEGFANKALPIGHVKGAKPWARRSIRPGGTGL